MKRYWCIFAGLLFASLLAIGVGASRAGIGLVGTITSFEFTDYDSVTLEYAADGPSPASDGYYGSFTWDYSISAGSGSYDYFVTYTWDQYDSTTDTWNTVNWGSTAVSDAAGSSGSHSIDFYADVADLESGYYQLTAWVCAGTDTAISTTYGGSNYVFAYGYDDPLPNPEPSPGPLPPDPKPTDPFPGLPPSGPAGPGTS